MSSVFCSECGVKNDASSTFCGNCGAQVSGGAKSAATTSQPMNTTSAPPSQPPTGYQQPPQKGYQQPQQGSSGYQAPPTGYSQPPAGYQQPAQGGGYQQGYGGGQMQPQYGGGYRPNRKDPGVGYIGALFIPGFAYFYSERVGEGVVYTILTWLLCAVVIGFLLWIGLFFSAGGVVKDWNRKNGYPE